jgi:hypothetical protein
LQTPEGNRLFSSSEDNGTFYLRLPNPPSGGNYTCRLSPFEPATSCLPQNSPLRDPEGASIAVDEVKASFGILAAEMAEQKTSFVSELSLVKNELNQTQSQLNQTQSQLGQTQSQLEQTKAELNAVKVESCSHLKQDLTTLEAKFSEYYSIFIFILFFYYYFLCLSVCLFQIYSFTETEIEKTKLDFILLNIF